MRVRKLYLRTDGPSSRRVRRESHKCANIATEAGIVRHRLSGSYTTIDEHTPNTTDTLKELGAGTRSVIQWKYIAWNRLS